MTVTPSDIGTIPSDRMFAAAVASSRPPTPNPAASWPPQTPPALRANEQKFSIARRERATVMKQPQSRTTMVPGAKNWESIVSATATTMKSAEPRSSGGDDDVGDDATADHAWPWPPEAPRACSSLGGHAEHHHHHHQHQWPSVMPPLPLGPSLRNITTITPSPIPGRSSALQDAAPAPSATTTTAETDTVAPRGARAEAGSADHFTRNIGADKLSITIPAPIMRRQTPSPLYTGDAAGDQSCVSREEQLSVDAVAWAAAAAEREKLELREEEEDGEEDEGEEDEQKEGKREPEQEQGREVESPFLSPPSAPPRLVSRYVTSAASATTAAAAGAAAAAGKNQKISTNSSSQGGLVMLPADDSRAARAARAYAAAAAARKARKQAAAAAAAAAMMPLQRREDADHERVTTPLGERRRHEARSVRRSPRE